jgi:cholesterol oxidase
MTDPATATTSVEFTEEMKGYVTFGETDFKAGFRQGKHHDTFLMFHLTIHISDVDRFVADANHPGSASGWIECEDLGGRRAVERGWFNLFVDADDPRMSHMLYQLQFTDGLGDPRTLSGFKEVKDDPGFDVWEDTSTLFTSLLPGHVAPGEQAAGDVTAAGILRIKPLDFAKQMTTFRTAGPNRSARTQGLMAFNKLFLGKLWDLYASKVSDASDDDEQPA